MTDALEDHEGTVNTGCRTINSLRFADDINCLAGEEEELAKLVECLNKASTAYGMEISAVKTKLMTKNTSGINTKIKVNGQKLETVFNYFYFNLCVDATGVVCHQLGLLGTDFHAVGCGSFVETLN